MSGRSTGGKVIGRRIQQVKVAGPVGLISRFRIKPGRLEDFRRFFQAGSLEIKRDKPGTVVFLCYLDQAASEAAILHVFPDAAAFDRHVEGGEERSQQAYEFLEPLGMELYGEASETASQMMEEIDGAGVPTKSMSQLAAGFLRIPESP